MKILYFGKICDSHIFKELEKKKKPYFVAQFLYEKALVDQILKYEDIELDVISIYQTEYYPNDRITINKNNKSNRYSYLSYINVPFLREICFFINAFIKILKWKNKNKNEKDLVILASNHFPPVSLAIVLAGKLLKIPKVVTFTDLSLFTYSNERISKMKLYKKIIIKPYLNLVNYLQKSYDGYVLFTEHMNKVVNIKSSPYCVVEGIFNENSFQEKDKLHSPKTKKVIAHIGTLNKEVGIGKILDVYSKLTTPNTELWFVGDGDMSEEIKDRAVKDSRIKHLGFLPKKDVNSILKQATLLINLRNSNDMYTKYSFPSKMFEYMASGTPVFTTQIEGIPKEYYKYVYSTNNYETPAIASYLNEILTKQQEELDDLGNKAKKFIYNNKTAEKQVNNILGLLFKVLVGYNRNE